MTGSNKPQCLSEIISGSGIAIVPTDTVYGMVGEAFNPTVFERMDTIKGSRVLPYSLMFRSLDQFREWYGELQADIVKIILALSSLPVTFVLPVHERIPHGFRYHQHGVGFRVYRDELLDGIFSSINTPLWATSVNVSGEPPPCRFIDISQSLLESVDLTIDGGVTKYGKASTVVDLRTFPVKVLRTGAMAIEIKKTIREL